MKIEKITFTQGQTQEDIHFSILIPTWNNLSKIRMKTIHYDE
jgi:hypothetical protein